MLLSHLRWYCQDWLRPRAVCELLRGHFLLRPLTTWSTVRRWCFDGDRWSRVDRPLEESRPADWNLDRIRVRVVPIVSTEMVNGHFEVIRLKRQLLAIWLFISEKKINSKFVLLRLFAFFLKFSNFRQNLEDYVMIIGFAFLLPKWTTEQVSASQSHFEKPVSSLVQE
jgi:hypothetical protein